MTNDQIIDEIIRREGGDQFTDRPSDRGGPTKFGITQRAWDDARPRLPIAVAYKHSVASLERSDARTFYECEHVEPFAWIWDGALRELVIDCSVNHGRGRATRWLQTASGVTADGNVGPKTLDAVNTREWDEERYAVIYRNVLIDRLRFYAKIASDQLPADPDLPNLRGWINRACEFIR